MRARNDLFHLFLYGGDGSQVEFEEALDDHATEIQKADAATVRAAKVREPIDEAERYVNAVLEDVAVKIEGGRG